jgi:hypothetical protein
MSASLRFVSQKLVSPTAQLDIQNKLIELANPSSLIGTDFEGLSSVVSTRTLGSYNFVGNVKSGQQVLAQYGSAKPDGTQFNKDSTLIPLISGGKVISSLILQKAIELGIISLKEKMTTYLPDLFTGTYTAVDTVDVTAPGFNAYDPSTYTVNISTGAFSDWTIQDLLEYKFGLFADGFQFGFFGQSLVTNYTGADLSGTFPEALITPFSLNFSYASYRFNQVAAATSNYTGSFVSALAGNNLSNTSVRDQQRFIFNQIRSGAIPLIFARNRFGIQSPNFNVNLLRQYCDYWTWIGQYLNNKLQALYVSNPVSYPWGSAGNSALSSFYRDQVLIPAGMNSTFLARYENPVTLGINTNLPVPQISRLPSLDPSLPQTITGNYVNLYPNALWSITPGLLVPPYSPQWYTGATYNFLGDGLGALFYNALTYSSVDYPLFGDTWVTTLSDFAKIFTILGNDGNALNGNRILSSQGAKAVLSLNTNPGAPLYYSSTIFKDSVAAGNGVLGVHCPEQNNPNDGFIGDITPTMLSYEGASGLAWVFDPVTGYFSIGQSVFLTLANYGYLLRGYDIIRNTWNLIPNDK